MNIYEQMTIFFSVKKNNFPLDFLITAKVPVEVLSKYYEICIKTNEITPIEKLPESERRKLAVECRATGLFFSNRTLIQSAKILHILKSVK